jgi:AcrR family transcriptional regulator
MSHSIVMSEGPAQAALFAAPSRRGSGFHIEVPSMRSLREEHAEATRQAILSAARKLFTAKGYDAAPINEIAAAARVTSGALYHHFVNKREIMRAVFENLEAELKDRITAASRGAKSAMQAFRLTLRAFLDACLEDNIRSIVFEQAPRVLGWEEWRRIDAEYAMGLLLDLLSRLRKERNVGRYDARILASLFLAALAEAGLQIASNRTDTHLRRHCERILQAFLAGLEVQGRQ